MVTTNLGLDVDGLVGAGPALRQTIAENFKKIDEALPGGGVPAFDPVADEGKVLKIVGGVLAWADDETGA